MKLRTIAAAILILSQGAVHATMQTSQSSGEATQKIPQGADPGAPPGAPVPPEIFKEMAQAFKMEGVANVVHDTARQFLSENLSQKLGQWTVEGLRELAQKIPDLVQAGAPDLNVTALRVAQDPELSKALKESLKQKLIQWQPELFKKVMHEGLYQNMLSEEDKQFLKGAAQIASAEMNKTINQQVDQWVGGFYNNWMGRLRNWGQNAFAIPGEAELAAKYFQSMWQAPQLSHWIADSMGEALGYAAVRGLQSQILDPLKGEVPEEVLDLVRQGPKALAKKAEGVLPWSQYQKLKARILNHSIMKLPNEAYGAILTAQAARHFALFAQSCVGFFASCNYHELQRAREVIETLTWQLKNKKALDVSLLDLYQLAKILPGKWDWGPLADLKQMIQENPIVKEIEKMEKRIKDLDQEIRKHGKKIVGDIKIGIDPIQKDLKGLADKMHEPFKKMNEKWAKIKEDTNRWKDATTHLCPINCIKSPCTPLEECIAKSPLKKCNPKDLKDWEGFKKCLGREEGLLGKWADKGPLDYWNEFDKKSGFKEGRRILNEDMAEKFSGAALWATDKLKITGPLAKILKVEKIPARHASKNSAFDPVYLHNGEFYYEKTDVAIPGRGLNYEFKRTYRSRSEFLGILGRNWHHNYGEALLAWESDEGRGLTWVDAEGKKFFFKEIEEGKYLTPHGLFNQLEKNSERFVLKFPDGRKHHFNSAGKLIKIEDRYANAITFLYDDSDNLVKVNDPFGREVHYRHDDNGLLSAIEDFSGRIWKFDYDDEAHLVAVTYPATPDFPEGITWRYRYSQDFGQPELNHNLTLIMDPKGQIYLQNFYGDSGEEFDRVTAQKYGNETYTIEAKYFGLNVEIKDRRATVHRYEHNEEGQLLKESWIDEKGNLQPLGIHQYDANGSRIRTQLASGLTIGWEYDDQGEPLREKIIPVKGEPLVHELGGGQEPHEYEHNDYGQIVSRRNQKGVVDQFVYYPASDPDGDGVTLPQARLDGNTGGYLKEMIRDANGLKARTSYKYDLVGNRAFITNPAGHTKQFSYNALGQVIKEVDPEPFLYTRTFHYDANGNLAATQVGEEIVYRFEYDILDNLTRFLLPAQKKKFAELRYEYDPEDHAQKMIFPEGNDLSFIYDALGRVTEVWRGASSLDRQIHKITYDAESRPILYTDGSGGRWQYHYDPYGRLFARTDPQANRIELQRDDKGRVIGKKEMDAKGNLISEEVTQYDSQGRILRKKNHLWRDKPQRGKWVEQSVQYAEDGSNEIFKDPSGNLWESYYNGLGRLVTVIDPMGNRQEYEYDAVGNLTSFKEGESVTRYSYDALGRLVLMDDPRGMKTQYQYDGQNNLVEKIDPDGTSVKYSYDFLGRRVAIDQDDGRVTTRYEWDANNRLKALIDATGARTEFAYDALDRLIWKKFSDGRWEQVAFGDHDKPEVFLDSSGRMLRNEYNAVGLITKRVAPHFLQEFEYDAAGRLVRAFDSNDSETTADDTVTEFAYDSFSRLIGEGKDGKWIYKNYDLLGNKVELIYPSGTHLYYHLDPIGRPQAIRLNDQILAKFVHKGMGQPLATSFANGLTERREYDPAGLLTGQRLEGLKEESIFEQKLDYDPKGRIRTVTNSVEGRADQFSYDALGRLSQASEEAFSYDPIGRLGGASPFELDARGNLIRDERLEYQYDDLGRLNNIHSLDGALIAEYDYDALGRRTGKNDKTQFFYDEWNLIEEEMGKDKKDFIWAGDLEDPIALFNGPGHPVNFYHNDFLGSPIAMSNAAGELIDRWKYRPFGTFENEGGATSNPILYTGQYWDAESELYYFKHRYYNPRLKQFLTSDPLGHKNTFYTKGAVVGLDSSYSAYSFKTSIPEMNLYQYALNDPVNFVDPLGLEIIMRREGNKTYIHLTLETSGPDATPKFNQLVKKAIEREYSGIFHPSSLEVLSQRPGDLSLSSLHVQTTVDVKLRQGKQDSTRHQMYFGEDVERSYVEFVGGSKAFIDPTPGGNLIDKVIAHEAGHWFGLDDKYRDVKDGNGNVLYSEPLKKEWELYLMANAYDSNAHIAREEIEEIWNDYRKQRLNFGIHDPYETATYNRLENKYSSEKSLNSYKRQCK